MAGCGSRPNGGGGGERRQFWGLTGEGSGLEMAHVGANSVVF